MKPNAYLTPAGSDHKAAGTLSEINLMPSTPSKHRPKVPPVRPPGHNGGRRILPGAQRGQGRPARTMSCPSTWTPSSGPANSMPFHIANGLKEMKAAVNDATTRHFGRNMGKRSKPGPNSNAAGSSQHISSVSWEIIAESNPFIASGESPSSEERLLEDLEAKEAESARRNEKANNRVHERLEDLKAKEAGFASRNEELKREIREHELQVRKLAQDRKFFERGKEIFRSDLPKGNANLNSRIRQHNERVKKFARERANLQRWRKKTCTSCGRRRWTDRKRREAKAGEAKDEEKNSDETRSTDPEFNTKHLPRSFVPLHVTKDYLSRSTKGREQWLKDIRGNVSLQLITTDKDVVRFFDGVRPKLVKGDLRGTLEDLKILVERLCGMFFKPPT